MRRLLLMAAVTAIVSWPAAALAHPLGNFTTNQYLGIYLTPNSIELDYVLDLAEIPTAQHREAIDLGDQGEAACGNFTREITVTLEGRPVAMATTGSHLSFPPGEAGLPTLRLECRLRGTIELTRPSLVEVVNESFAERLGWKEMTVGGRDITVVGEVPSDSVTKRLTAYPQDRLASPIEITTATFTVEPAPGSATGSVPPPLGSVSPGANPVDRLASLIDPTGGAPALPLAMAVAVGLGVVHALAPGHGKTVMAAYLVGSRGTARQALVLGLAVAASHTVGVLALGLVTLAGTAAFAPETVFPVLSTISGLIVTGIGLWLGWRWLRDRDQHQPDHNHGHQHHHDHHQHGPEHHHHDPGHSPPGDESPAGWKVLASMGLAGGLVPSASAVVLLLAAVNLGRVSVGLLLIVLFGLGMAATLVGVGYGLVKASDFGLERWGSHDWINRLRTILTPAAALVVVGVGLFLTFRP